MFKNNFRAFFASLMFALSLAVVSFAQTSPSPFGNVKIRNFGQMDEQLYRGAARQKISSIVKGAGRENRHRSAGKADQIRKRI